MTKQIKAGAGNVIVGDTPMTQDRALVIQSRAMKDKGAVSIGNFAARNGMASGER